MGRRRTEKPGRLRQLPPLGLVLLRFLLEKIVFPQLEERIPGLEYACWKGWIIKPTPLLSTLRPLEGVSPQSTGEESGDESEDYESYTYVLDERYPLRGEIVPGGVGVDFEGTMIALNMKGEVVIHDSKIVKRAPLYQAPTEWKFAFPAHSFHYNESPF